MKVETSILRVSQFIVKRKGYSPSTQELLIRAANMHHFLIFHNFFFHFDLVHDYKKKKNHLQVDRTDSLYYK